MTKKKSLTPEADNFRKLLSKLEVRISNALLGSVTCLQHLNHSSVKLYPEPRRNNDSVDEGPIVEVRFAPRDQTEYGLGGDDFVRGVALVGGSTVGLIIGNNSGADEEYRLAGELDVDMLKLVEALAVVERMVAG
jgi:hypothetical protein